MSLIKEIENKIKFPKPGTFIMLIRRLLLLIGIVGIAGFGLAYSENSDDEFLYLLVVLAILIALIAAFVGRKTVKKEMRYQK